MTGLFASGGLGIVPLAIAIVLALGALRAEGADVTPPTSPAQSRRHDAVGRL